MAQTSGFTSDQVVALQEKLPRDVVRERRGGEGKMVRYLPGWHVIDTANKVFGFDGWDYRILEITEVYSGTKKGNSGENLIGVVQATVEVRVAGVVRQDVGLDSWDTPANGLLAGIDKARKGCVTDALKRALRSFGNIFGNSLYDKESVLGLSRSAREALDEIEALPDDATAVLWWRKHRDAIADLDTADQAEVQSAFNERRQSFLSAQAAPTVGPGSAPEPAPAPPQPPPVAPPAAPAVAPAPVAPVPPFVAPVPQPGHTVFGPPAPPVQPVRKEPPPKVTGVSTAILAMQAADTVEALRAIPKALDTRTLATVDREDLQAAYATALHRLDKGAWLLARAVLAKTDEAREPVFNDAAEMLRDGLVSEEAYGKVIRSLGGAR